MPKLRNLRTQLRTLLHLEYKKRIDKLNKEWDKVLGDNSLTYGQKIAKQKMIWQSKEKLTSIYNRRPISCRLCNKRDQDLILEQETHCWYCTSCHELVIES